MFSIEITHRHVTSHNVVFCCKIGVSVTRCQKSQIVDQKVPYFTGISLKSAMDMFMETTSLVIYKLINNWYCVTKQKEIHSSEV